MENTHDFPTLKRYVSILVAFLLGIANLCLCTEILGNALVTQAHLTITSISSPPMNGGSGITIHQCSSTSKSKVDFAPTPEQVVRRMPAAPTEGAKSLGGVVSGLRSILVQDSEPTKSTQDCDPNVCIVVVGVNRPLLLLFVRSRGIGGSNILLANDHTEHGLLVNNNGYDSRRNTRHAYVRDYQCH